MNLKGKWPLTRAERIQELEELVCHYEVAIQRENFIAAQAWHSLYFLRTKLSPTKWSFFNREKFSQNVSLK